MSSKKPTGVLQRHRKSCTGAARCGCPWGFVVELPAGADGKRRQVTKGGFSGMREAKAARDAVLNEHRTGTLAADRSLTVAVYLRRWLARKTENGTIRPATAASYTRHVEDLLIPQLGHRRLHELRPHHIESAYRTISKANPGLGATSLNRVHATLRSATRNAVKRGELVHDPCSHVELPKATRPRVDVWSISEWRQFIGSEAVVEHPMRELFEVAARTGLRRGELVALRWSDIDLDAGVVTVKRQDTVVGHAVHTGPPKTASGDHRLVDLDDGTVELLRGAKRTQKRERLRWGPAWQDTEGRVFTRKDGAAWHPERVTKTFIRLSDKAGVRRVKFHGLRHLQASLMLAAGVEVGIVSKRLGHSTTTITADTYSHLLPGVGKAAATAAANLLTDAANG